MLDVGCWMLGGVAAPPTMHLRLLPFLFLSASLLAADPTPIPLWPSTAPGEKGDIGEEKDITKPTDGKPGGKPIIRLGNVSRPTITVYAPPAGKANGTAVVVCPGGA